MAFDYEKYERQCEIEKEKNKIYLKEFEDQLIQAGLSAKTIRQHLENVEFYLNTYMLREDAEPMENGVSMISSFLGYFFIRKCMWSTPATIKSTAASIKKFYKSMLSLGHIDKDDYNFLCETIKEEMPDWIRTCKQYNNPNAANPFDLDWF